MVDHVPPTLSGLLSSYEDENIGGVDTLSRLMMNGKWQVLCYLSVSGVHHACFNFSGMAMRHQSAPHSHLVGAAVGDNCMQGNGIRDGEGAWRACLSDARLMPG